MQSEVRVWKAHIRMRRASKQGFLGNDLGAINSSPVGAVAVVCGKRKEGISEAQ